MATEPDWIKLSGYHPRYASLSFSVIREPYALSLIDSNTDGREIGLIVLARRGNEWELEAELDDVAEEMQGWCDEFVWAYGRAEPRSSVSVRYRDALHDSATDGSGWWAFFHRAGPDADGTFEPPERVN